MRYFKLGSIMAMVALSFSLAQPAKAYLFGLSDIVGTNNRLEFSNGSFLPLIDGGWYNGATHFSFTENYIVAQANESLPGIAASTDAYRNFFIVDIPVGFALAPGTSASLKLFSYDVTTSETYTLRDVTTEIHVLIDEDLSISADDRLLAFNDLGDGKIYGSSDYVLNESTPFDIPPKFHNIPLNQDFISAINAASSTRSNSGRFAFAGEVDTYRTVPPNVPEPSTLLLLGLALVGLAAWRRKHAA